MKITIIGKFKKLYDEEYIARSFEMLGHEVQRLDERNIMAYINGMTDEFNPDLVIWTKLQHSAAKDIRSHMMKYKTVCWVFDLYFGYAREYRLTSHPAFTADYVFTTDGGHDEDFKKAGINHHCVRQGIFKEDCFLLPSTAKDEIVFVGSENPLHLTRAKQIDFVNNNYPGKFKWYGRFNSDEIRDQELNELYAKTAIVIGDSVYSPHYWSNRVVETLGRGGFLIHRDVPGIKEEYPHLVTYDGTLDDLKAKIDYYLTHDRNEIIQKNFEWVRDNYTMEKQCQKLLNFIS